MALWIQDESVELRPNATEEDLQGVIRAVYRQVLGNAHVLDEQRLVSAESQLRNGELSVREFVRAVAQSDLYRARFFDSSSPYRFIELNFKHLLGRAPQDQAEISEHVQLYNTQGYEAEINSYLSSDEYLGSFGENMVPSPRSNRSQTGIKNITFNRTFALMRGFAANDVGRAAKLVGDLGQGLATKIVAPGAGLRRKPLALPPSMPGTSATYGLSSQLRASLSDRPAPVKWVTGASPDEAETIIRSVYRQVLGKDLMESERLVNAESQLCNGDITLRSFVRAVAQSDLYRARFFETASPYRFIESNFKHLLGRAPQDQAEISEHVQTYTTQGFNAEIDSYIDSDEYLSSFGETIVPYLRGNQTQTGVKNATFNRTFTLVQGFSGSDVSTSAKLINEIGGNASPAMVTPTGSPGANMRKTGMEYRDPVSQFDYSIAKKYGVGLFEQTTVADLVPNRDPEEADAIIRAVYYQVFGNAYVMESERLTVPESQFKRGELTVREFIRALAKSELYRTWFFSSCSRYRSIELNFRHLLGRPPLDLEEMRYHSNILDTEGFDAEIDSYLDSDEYSETFGDHVVPYIRGYHTESCQSLVQFTHTFELVRGASSSSRKSNLAGNTPRLNALVINSTPTTVSAPDAMPMKVEPVPQEVAPVRPVSRLGVSLFDETPLLEWVPGRSDEEAETIIRAVYRQVLGNAYVMESERLTVPESQFKLGELSVREFVREVAKSELYRSRFFTSCARYRAIELNFRHLLGRPPYDLEEMRGHSTILDTEGFEADIDSYLDSDEYQDNFGENLVPTIRGYKTEACTSMVQFTHTFQLVRGASSSSLKGDVSGKTPKLNALVINQTAVPVVSPGGKGATFRKPAISAPTRLGTGASEKGKVYRIEVTGYRANKLSKVSRFRRANQVYMVPFDDLSATFRKIQRQGGVIASVKAV